MCKKGVVSFFFCQIPPPYFISAEPATPLQYCCTRLSPLQPLEFSSHFGAKLVKLIFPGYLILTLGLQPPPSMEGPTSQPPGAEWLMCTFDPGKAARGYSVSADGKTAKLDTGGKG